MKKKMIKNDSQSFCKVIMLAPIYVLAPVIASVISYYICWVWLIGTHFQMTNFNIYMVQYFLMQKK
jgi:hypothetical protein